MDYLMARDQGRAIEREFFLVRGAVSEDNAKSILRTWFHMNGYSAGAGEYFALVQGENLRDGYMGRGTTLNYQINIVE